MHSTAPTPERAFLVAVQLRSQTTGLDANASLEELALLAHTAGAEVVGSTVQRLESPHPAHYIGKGKLEEVIEARDETGYTMVIFDDELSPSQQRNLENALKVKVLDRTALIIDIFARRARTKEARLQVELAQLEYLLPRLAGQWSHLERLEGRIGTRGPGETQLETDRRLVRNRLTRRVRMPSSHEVLWTDTVGFIQKLPTQLVASFRATLEELADADVLVHLVDITHENAEEQYQTVERTLEELGLAGKPRVVAFNKVDLLAPQDGHDGPQSTLGSIESALKAEHPEAVLISAARQWNLESLLRTVEAELAEADARQPALA